ncbi:MAG: hypothetical protein ABIE68_03500 [bacterium]
MKRLTIVLMMLVGLFLTGYTVFAQSYIGGYVSYNMSSDLGFENGVGGLVEMLARGKKYALFLDGEITNEEKNNADGYTYHYSLVARRYWGESFLGLGARESGYHSKFPDSIIWEKSPLYGTLEAGKNNLFWDLDFHLRLFAENQTINRTRAVELQIETWVLEGERFVLWMRINTGIINFVSGISEERRNGYATSLSLGIKYGL